MQDFVYQNRKKIIVAGVVALVLIIGISIYFIVWNMLNSVTVNITVTPSIAKVMIGEREFGTLGDYKIMPGEYEVVVSAEGFVTKTGKLVAVADETVNVSMYLEPTEENKDWYLNHPEDALIMGDIKSDYTARDLAKLREEKPILKQLPIEINYYTANYAKRVHYVISYVLVENNTDFIITVTDYTGGNYEDALAKLVARGVDLDEYHSVHRCFSGT